MESKNPTQHQSSLARRLIDKRKDGRLNKGTKTDARRIHHIRQIFVLFLSLQIVNTAASGGIPVVTVDQSAISVHKGFEASIQCKITSNPPVQSLYWLKNGERIDFARNPDKFSAFTPATPSLLIHNVDQSDGGQYICVAVNEVGTGRGSPIQLTVVDIPGVTIETSPITVPTGVEVTLRCYITTNSAPLAVYWLKDGARVHFSENPYKYEATNPQHPNLSIHNVELSDSGEYTCVAYNEIGTQMSSPVQLKVN